MALAGGSQALAQITVEVLSAPDDTTEVPDGYLNDEDVLVGVDDATVTLPVTLTISPTGIALFEINDGGVIEFRSSVTLTEVGELATLVSAGGSAAGDVNIDADDGIGTGSVEFFYGNEQIINFPSIGEQVFIDTPVILDRTIIELTATAQSDAANAIITYTSNNGVATITNAAGVPDINGSFARIDAAGTASITATTLRTSDFLSVEVENTFEVITEPEPQFIEFTAPESLKFGDFPFVVEARAVDQFGAPTFREVTLTFSSGPGLATDIVNPGINPSVLVTALGSGAISIQASAAGDTVYDAATSSITIPIEAVDTSTGALILDQWTWRNPQPTPADGRFNDFLEAEGVLVAVGDSIAAEAQIFTSVDGINWASTAGLPNTNLLSIAHGNGTFVAVGTGGVVLTSPDGITWNQEVSGTAADLRGITYESGSTFVAVGAGGEVIISLNDGVAWNPAVGQPSINATDLNAVVADGLGTLVAVGQNSIVRSVDGGNNWTTILLGISFSLNDVLIDGSTGTYVAVGEGSTIISSPAGVIWSTKFTGADFNLTGIAQGNGLFVAVGEEGRLVTSPDIETWTQRTSRFEIGFQGVGFGNGAFFAVGDGFSIFSSPTGEGWTIRESAFDSELQDMAFGVVGGANQYVAVGEDGLILISPDGITWSDAASVPVASDLMGVTFGANTFIAVGEGGVIITSSDGDTWVTATDSGVTTTSHLRDIVFNEGSFVAVGDGFTIISSTDGDNWTAISSGFGNDFNAIAANNGRFIAVGDNGLIYVSDDASSWAPVFSGTAVNLQGVSSDGQSFVAVGDAGVALFSNSGDSWSGTNTGIDGDLKAITSSPSGVYVATGEDFSFLTSRNGIDWSSQTSGTLNTLHGIGFGDGLFVAVGDFESILTSSDVINSGLDNWTFSNPVIDGVTVNDIVYAGGRYVAVGDGGLVLISSDGEIWEEIDAGTTNNLNAVNFGSNTYIIVGENVILRSVDGGDTWTLNVNWLVDFEDIEFADGRFVAVGAGGTGIFTNNLGLNWSLSGMDAEGADLFGVAYGGGWWVALGGVYSNVDTNNIPENAYSMFIITVSRDGINWTRRFAPLLNVINITYYTDVIRDVTFGNGVFLAAGDQLIISTTPAELEEDDPIVDLEVDEFGVITKRVFGSVWDPEVVGSSNWRAVTYGEPQGQPTFVVVNDAGGAFTSEDGDSYVVSFPGISEAFTGVAYGNNEFIASAENGRILSSADGDRWTVRSTAFLDILNGVTTNAPESVAVGDDGIIFLSTDSVTWNQATDSQVYPVNLNATAYGNGRHVVVGDNGWRMTSSDGDSWRPRTSNLNDDLNGVVYGLGDNSGSPVERFVAVGDNGAVTISDDGITWTAVTPLLGNLNAVANGGGNFVAVADNATIYTSANGVVWSLVDNATSVTGDLIGNLNGVTYGNGVFVLVGQNGLTAYSGDNGLTWTAANSTGISTELFGITFGDGFFVSAGSDGSIVTSTNGVIWRKRPSNSTNLLTAVGFNSETFTAVGAFSTILSSQFSNRLPQAISFNAIPDQSLGSGAIPLSAVASSGLPVSYFVVAGSASIQNGNQLVLSETATVPSTVTVRATQPGDEEFSAADPIDRTFSIINRLQVIEFPEIDDVTFGEDGEVSLEAASSDVITGLPTNLPITYTVISGSATLSQAGNILIIAGAGTVTVRASQAGDETYAAADSVNQTFDIALADQGIVFPEIPDRGINQFPFTPLATSFRLQNGVITEDDTGLTVQFSVVGGTADASVINNQIVLGAVVSGQTIIVEANQPGNANYNAAASLQQTITLVDETQTVSWIEPLVGSVALGVGSIEVGAVSSEGAAITYTVVVGTAAEFQDGPSDPTLTLVSIGDVTIRATAAAIGGASETFIEQVITIAGTDQAITFAELEDKFSTDPPFELTATASSGLDIVYTITGGENVASVSGSTVTLTGVSGVVTIQANQPGNSEFAAAEPVSQSFTVIDAEIGDSWSLQTSPVSSNLTGTGFVDELFFATGATSSILTASDGTDWVSRAGGSNTLNDIAVGGSPSVYVAIGEDGVPLTSSDGINWQLVTSPITDSLNSVIFAAGRFIAVGDGGFVAVSFDGTTWITIAANVTANLSDIIFVEDRFIVVGGNVILVSDDFGQSWTTTAELSSNFQLNSITTSDDTLMAVGNSFLVITSTDNGNSWLVRPAAGDNNLNSVAYGANRFVSVGSGGGIFTSDDAISWEQRDSGTENILHSIAFVDDIFVAVGDGGTILTSGAATIKETQSIDFDSIPVPADGSVTTTLTATALDSNGLSNGLTVRFDVIDGTATISNVQNIGGTTTATLTLSGTPGLVTVRASQPGNSNFYAADNQDQSLAIAGEAQVLADLSPAAGNLAFTTAPYTLSALSQDASTGQATGIDVEFELISGDATLLGNILTLNSNSVDSSIVLRAFNAGNDTYEPLSETITYIIIQETAEIIFEKIDNKLLTDADFFIIAKTSNGEDVGIRTIVGSDLVSLRSFLEEDIAGNQTVRHQVGIKGTDDATGLVTFEAFTTSLNSSSATPVTQSFFISRFTQNITFGDVGEKTFGDGDFDVNATADGGGIVTLALADPTVATLDGTTVSIKTAGVITITATAAASSNGEYGPAEGELMITVAKAPQELQFDPIDDQFALAGTTITLGAQTFINGEEEPASRTDFPIVFSIVTGQERASISGSVLTLNGTPGTVTVQASQAGNSNVQPATAVQRTFAVSSFGRVELNLTTVINGSAFGNQRHVAVGELGTVARSIISTDDPTRWESVATPSTNDLTDIAFGNGRFVAVGGFGTSLVSTDGADWSSSSVGTPNLLNAIAFGDGKFVTVTAGGIGFNSGNGQTWSQFTLPVLNPLNDIEYGQNSDGGPQFVAAGTVGTIVTSGDGANWTLRDTGTQLPLNGVAYGQGLFVVVADSRTYLFSENGGATWQRRVVPLQLIDDSVNLNSISFGATSFRIVGANGLVLLASPEAIIQPTNLTTGASNWVRGVSLGTDDLLDVSFGGDRFVTTGAAGTILISLPESSIFTSAASAGDTLMWSEWFGFFDAVDEPWIYHYYMGWMYVLGTENSMWAYSPTFGWIWTAEGTYPWFVQADSGVWYFYAEDTFNPALFLNTSTGEWEAYN